MSNSNATTVGTGYNTTAITRLKIMTMARKNPALAEWAYSVFGLSAPTGWSSSSGMNQGQGPTNANASVGYGSSGSGTGATRVSGGSFTASKSDSSQQVNKYTKNVLQTIFSAENYLNGSAGGSGGNSGGPGSIGGALSSATSGINDLSTSISSGLAAAKADLAELLKPVSSFTGATLGTLPNLLKNPMGAPLALAESIAHVVDRVSPGFTNRIDATIKKYNLENLANLPDQIIGGVRNLLSKVDSLLAVPFSYLSDLYNGLMSLMKSIGEVVDSLLQSVFNFFFGPNGMLDQLFPISQILQVLQAVGELFSMFSMISNLVGGIATVNNIIGQVNGFLSQATSILSNPQQLIMSYIPSQVTDVISSLRNPEQFLSSIIPPEVSGLLSQISSVSGLGFSSNLGYGLGGVLESIKGGILTKVFDQYTKQLGILSPKLGQSSESGTANTQQDHTPTVGTSPIGGQPVVQGVPIDTQPRGKIIPDNTSSSSSTSGGSFTAVKNSGLPNSVSWNNVTSGVQGWNTFANSSQPTTWQND
jgi:hypothetical protein